MYKDVMSATSGLLLWTDHTKTRARNRESLRFQIFFFLKLDIKIQYTHNFKLNVLAMIRYSNIIYEY